jgi:tRNA (adenine-N(1)-)-methyltransferase non-catalytic subunit
VQYDVVDDKGSVIMRTNRLTVDSAARQTLTMEQIEELKKSGSASGKDLIAKLMEGHTSLDEKTSFSLAKYKLLKTKKYLRQFKVLPLDVAMLTEWIIEQKDAQRIMEMRAESLGLVGCWANVHYAGDPYGGLAPASSVSDLPSSGRWLIVDEIGGLLVAAMAERMGILHPASPSQEENPKRKSETEADADADAAPVDPETDTHAIPISATNTLTLLHPAAQPNLSLLKYFHFTPDSPSPSHPLSSHFRTLSWLQLLKPEADSTYSSLQPTATAEQLAAMKSGKRGQFYRKRRRWARVHETVDETRAGGFDGLIVASPMDPVSVLAATVPLLKGGAQVVVYSPTVEPLVTLTDCYSTSRRTAFIQAPPAEGDLTNWAGDDDFPLNPTLLVNSGVQTSRVREWQVLPGRTHPLMTSRGGAEGYVFSGTRVIPAEGRVEARGKYKRRKVEEGGKVVKEGGSGEAETNGESEEVVKGEEDLVMTES